MVFEFAFNVRMERQRRSRRRHVSFISLYIVFSSRNAIRVYHHFAIKATKDWFAKTWQGIEQVFRLKRTVRLLKSAEMRHELVACRCKTLLIDSNKLFKWLAEPIGSMTGACPCHVLEIILTPLHRPIYDINWTQWTLLSHAFYP